VPAWSGEISRILGHFGAEWSVFSAALRCFGPSYVIHDILFVSH
jgi:hypothetical protein